MRQKRAKAYRKQMLVYNHTFKFREPYQVIVDDTLVLLCDKQSFDLQKGLSRTLQAEVKPMITQCCMQALYDSKNQQAIDLAKGFERRRCNHFKDPKPSHECIKSIVDIDGENKHRYVVACDNERLRYSLRKIPGVPLVYMNRAVMVMESLSKASAKISEVKEQGKLTGGLNNAKGGATGAEGEKNKEEEVKPKKRKGPSEPNPLSMKKKKVDQTPKTGEGQEEGEKKKARKRKHKKASIDNTEEEKTTTSDAAEASEAAADAVVEPSKDTDTVAENDDNSE